MAHLVPPERITSYHTSIQGPIASAIGPLSCFTRQSCSRQLVAKGISACGGPINLDRSAPGLGRNFCVRPPVASAMYRFPSESTENWCMFQSPPGNVPCVPHEVISLPVRSNLVTLLLLPPMIPRCPSP